MLASFSKNEESMGNGELSRKVFVKGLKTFSLY